MNTSKKPYLKLASHYRNCLYIHGDKPLGMDWPRAPDNQRRHRIMMELFLTEIAKRKKKVKVVDFGCGTSHFYEYLLKQGLKNKIEYIGIDILSESIAISKKKFPKNKYYCMDIMAPNSKIPSCDFITVNGLFTQRRNMSDSEMKAFLKKVIIKLFSAAKSAIAFNTLSDQVDFKRPASFHLNLDWTAKFLAADISRNFLVRHDYGLYENTFYIYKKEK